MSTSKHPAVVRLGAMIREAREAKNRTQRELGLALGYKDSATEAVVSKWEAGRQAPPLAKVDRLCSTLGLDRHEVVRLCLEHRHPTLSPGLVGEVEGGLGRQAPSELERVLVRLSPERRRRVEETALYMAKRELEEQEKAQ